MLSVFFASCASTKNKAEAAHQLHDPRRSRDAFRERSAGVAAGRETGQSMIRGNQTAVWMHHARTAAQAACPSGPARVPVHGAVGLNRTAIATPAPWVHWRALASWTGFLEMTRAPFGTCLTHTIDSRTGRDGSLGRRLYV
jgi:hypothetical protein